MSDIDYGTNQGWGKDIHREQIYKKHELEQNTGVAGLRNLVLLGGALFVLAGSTNDFTPDREPRDEHTLVHRPIVKMEKNPSVASAFNSEGDVKVQLSDSDGHQRDIIEITDQKVDYIRGNLPFDDLGLTILENYFDSYYDAAKSATEVGILDPTHVFSRYTRFRLLGITDSKITTEGDERLVNYKILGYNIRRVDEGLYYAIYYDPDEGLVDITAINTGSDTPPNSTDWVQVIKASSVDMLLSNFGPQQGDLSVEDLDVPANLKKVIEDQNLDSMLSQLS